MAPTGKPRQAAADQKAESTAAIPSGAVANAKDGEDLAAPLEPPARYLPPRNPDEMAKADGLRSLPHSPSPSSNPPLTRADLPKDTMPPCWSVTW